MKFSMSRWGINDIKIKILICDTLEIIIISDTATEIMIKTGHPCISIARDELKSLLIYTGKCW